MLYDKRWDPKVETKADPWDVDAFIGWLETMPPETEYRFTRAATCLITQYLQFRGAERPVLYSREIPEPFKSIANVRDGNLTFGAALARARAIQRSRS